MKLLITKLIPLLFFSILVSACSTRTQLPFTPQPAVTNTPLHLTSTTTPAQIITSILNPSSTVPVSTSTPIPPTAIVAQTPGPINSPGPWIAINEIMPGNEREITSDHWLVGAKDGSSWQVLNVPFPTPLPDEPWQYRTWKLSPGKGGMVAAYTSIYEYAFTQSVDDPANQIWIVQLPENKLARVLPLIGPAGLVQIQKEQEEIRVKELNRALPVTLGTIGNPHWSPDGRYLAYSAALESPKADIYVYDTLKDQTNRLTQGQNNAWVSSWAPDGNHILFYEVRWQGYRTLSPIGFSSMKVVAMDGQVRQIVNFSNPSAEENALWLDNSRLLLFTRSDMMGGDLYLRDLRVYDSKIGAIRSLFQDDFVHLAVDPVSSTVLISTFDLGSPQFPPAGVYQVNIETGDLTLLIKGEFGYINWNPNLELFSVRFDQAWNEGNAYYDFVFLSNQGKEKMRFHQVGENVYPSPDGRRFLISHMNKFTLMDAKGNNIKEVNQTGQDVTWLADSSGFYFGGFSYDGFKLHREVYNIYYYSQTINWSETLIYTGNRNLNLGSIVSILP